MSKQPQSSPASQTPRGRMSSGVKIFLITLAVVGVVGTAIFIFLLVTTTHTVTQSDSEKSADVQAIQSEYKKITLPSQLTLVDEKSTCEAALDSCPGRMEYLYEYPQTLGDVEASLQTREALIRQGVVPLEAQVASSTVCNANALLEVCYGTAYNIQQTFGRDAESGKRYLQVTVHLKSDKDNE